METSTRPRLLGEMDPGRKSLGGDRHLVFTFSHHTLIPEETWGDRRRPVATVRRRLGRETKDGKIEEVEDCLGLGGGGAIICCLATAAERSTV